MELILLGSGGSIPFPRPFCNCKICSKARRKGVPYARWGPSLFVEDESILFDTPEEIRLQLEREKKKRIKHVFYTHSHSDHTIGMRIFRHINFVYVNDEPPIPINVYLPENAIQDFEKNCSYLFYVEKKKNIKINRIRDRQPVQLGEVKITPLDFRRSDRIRYGYLIEKDGKRVVYAPCSTFGIYVDDNYRNLDVLFLEIGWLGDTEKNRKILPKDHIYQDHVSFEENINIIEESSPKMTVLTHIDGTRHLKKEGDHDFLLGIARKYSKYNIKIGYDGMKIKL